jgi:hypothetical protein
MDSQNKYPLQVLREKSANTEKQQATGKNPRVKSKNILTLKLSRSKKKALKHQSP